MSDKKQNKQKENRQVSQIAKDEEAVLDFWDKAKIFEKSVKNPASRTDKDIPNYVFYDGPPFITGLPHYATLLPSIAKDMIPRYWTMKGHRVKRVWGWDCHGLPAENKVEKELELKNKKDIEKLGVDKFVDACRNYVNTGSEQWQWYINRIARWVDMDNAYKTMDTPFMESVIWAFKTLFDKGLIYEGYRSSLHCPRCATPLSKFEITMDAGSYKDVNDESVTVKFKIKNEKLYHARGVKIKNLGIKDGKNVYILAWTTTPWTLPGNLALAVGENIEYQILSIKGENNYYITAKERVEDVFENKPYEVIKEIKGKDLIGLEYEPVFNLENDEFKKSEKTYKIYVADFVSTEDGTGVVHIAPNFGEDDFELGKAIGLPMLDLMDEMGVYTELAGAWAGIYFKKANTKVLEELGESLFAQATHIHSYPFCYRCDTRLIYKTQKAWYLKISEIRGKMLETNKDINWVPEHFKEGRFRHNIESAPDWCLSRSRYWGSPIPVWRCEDCGELKVVGSIEELEKLSGERVEDLHRPAIDKPEIDCPKCQNKMKRVKEVLDCWFESGSMPFAQFHYPFKLRGDVDLKNPDFDFPSDFIIEYTGQLRGWFYYLHVISNALFNNLSFKNVIVSGVLAGTDGRKMSKSYGNYPDPKLTLDKYGADALRIYFMQSSIMNSDDTSLSEKDIQDALRKNIFLLMNVTRFYKMFRGEVKADSHAVEPELNKESHILDKWIIYRLNQLIKQVTDNLEKYNLPTASRAFTPFIDDLSTWYLRRSRDRFKSNNEKDKENALEISRYILITLAKVIAPLAPFVAEKVWQTVTGFDFQDKEKSVHLEAWPKAGKVDNKILEEMEATRKIVELALAKRDEAKIKVRQPLSDITVVSPKTIAIKNAYIELIKDEVNIKEVKFNGTSDEISVELNIELTPELKQEGLKRELVRLINAKRKKMGLTINDKVNVEWQAESEIKAVIEMYNEELLRDTLALKFIEIKEEIEEVKKERLNEFDILLRIEKQ